jgi:hypothetical protein
MDAAVHRGCTAHYSFTICQSPLNTTRLRDGAVVVPDGAPAGEVCSDACGVDEFSVVCQGGAQPDRPLHCTLVPLDSFASFYCCPCPSAAP